MLRKRTVQEQVVGVLAASVLFAPILRINYLPMLVPCVLVWWKARVDKADTVSTSSSSFAVV